MWKPYYGEPTLTVRLPIWQHDALKTVARRRYTNVSALLRRLIFEMLAEEGLVPDGEQQNPPIE